MIMWSNATDVEFKQDEMFKLHHGSRTGITAETANFFGV